MNRYGRLRRHVSMNLLLMHRLTNPHRFILIWSCLLGFAGVRAVAAPEPIVPGAIWPDDHGNHIQAHGAGVLKQGDTYYLFGEDRSRGLDPAKRYVSCYASTDLSHWAFRNRVLALGDPENLGVKVLERPKVFYNQMTRKYVMYMHIDDPHYKLARVGVATCDTVDGNYEFQRSFRPLGDESRDIGQFVDDDGTAYLIFEDRPHGFHIAKLSADYLSVAEDTHFFPKSQGGALEGGALVHYNGLYYVVGSQMSSWAPNANHYATAPALEGPWSPFQDIAPPEVKTYGSQSSMLLKVVGSKTTTVIFMGDIWKPSAQWNSRYLWMPLQIGDGKMTLPPPKPWTMDVVTGEAVIGQ
jgi:hypothetical protein